MMADLYRIGTTWVVFMVLLPYAVRFDLKILGGLSLHGPRPWGALWPFVTWVRALSKPCDSTTLGSRLVVLMGCVLLLGAGVVVLVLPGPPLAWAMLLLACGRLLLAVASPMVPSDGATRHERLIEGLVASAVLALALTGPVTLAAWAEAVGSEWLVLRQPLALLVACVATTGAWVEGVGDREVAEANLTFQRLHAGGTNAWLVTGSYAWWTSGMAMVMAAFLPSLIWTLRLTALVGVLGGMLWLRRFYVLGLRRRLAWRFWPLLAALAGASLAVTAWMLPSASG